MAKKKKKTVKIIPLTEQSRLEDAPKELKKTDLAKKMAQKHKEIKKERSEKAKERIRKSKENKKKPPAKIDFLKLDSTGKPLLSFDPKSKTREALLIILSYTKRDGIKKMRLKELLEKKLHAEITRVYKIYMRMKWQSKHSISKPPISDESCDRYAVQIGKSCIINGITPRQLWEYWDVNIVDFADRDMKFPPLSFLASPMAAEKVASAVFEDTNAGMNKWSGSFTRKDSGHSFHDTGKLHPELRNGLIKANFLEGRTWSDRHLLTIQNAAMSILRNESVFIGGIMKEMVDWAIENIFRSEYED